jgi:hypothetical protein
MKKAIFLILFFSVILTISGSSLAEVKKSRAWEGIEFLSGFAWGDLKAQKKYQLVPLIVDFDFNLKPLLQKLNFNPRPLIQFQIEPFIGLISSPQPNLETGMVFFLKLGFLPSTSKFQPYIKIGAGLEYMSLHTREQSTQYNFIEYGGVGMHYFFRKNTALTLEGRFRHLSNCGIKEPNHGINAYFAIAGIAYQF